MFIWPNISDLCSLNFSHQILVCSYKDKKMHNLNDEKKEIVKNPQSQIFALSLKKRMGSLPDKEVETISNLLFEKLSPLLGEKMESLPEEEIEKISDLFLEKLVPEVMKRMDDLDDEQDEIIIKCDLEKMARTFFKDSEIIWHDPNVNSQENQQYLVELEKLCKVKTFSEWKEAENYIKAAKTICHVITSGANGELFVKEIFLSANVPKIFIFCLNGKYRFPWAKYYDKVLCTETKIEDVIFQIQKNLMDWQEQTSSLKFALPAFAPIFDENYKSDMNHLHHYLKVIPNFHNRAQAKRDFLNLSKRVYKDEENNIARFEKIYNEYDMEAILKWYTQQLFLYKVINNCLRIATSDSIQYCRFLLKDVEKAIKDQYQAKSKNFSGLLFRGACLSEEEWASLKANVNKEIEIQGFLSVTKDEKIALRFVKGDPSKVLITILVPKGPSEEEQGFAEVEQFSLFPQEQEVLFNVRSRFTILETDDGGTKDFSYRHLVLLYGAQGLRKFVTEKNPLQQVSIEDIKNISCSGCKILSSEMAEKILFKSLRDLKNPIYSCKRCFDPNLAPFLWITLKGKIPTTIKGCLLTNPRQTQIPFYGYQCSKCGVKNQKGYFVCTNCCKKKMKWCKTCFESTLNCIEIGHSILFETCPFSFWCEGMGENELNRLKYQTNLLQNSNHVFQQAQMYFETHEYENAILCYNFYIEQNEATANDGYLATSYSNLGMIYEKRGEYDKALECCLKALDISKSVDGENHNNNGIYSNNIGLVYERLERYNKALKYYMISLDIFKSIHGESHPAVATSYNNFGLVYSKLGDYDKALEYHFKALDIEKSIYGENHPLISASYNNIGTAYGEQEEYEKALEYCLKSLDIDRLIIGEKHPDIANSYNNIGFIYGRLGEYIKAHEYCLKALDICQSTHGEIHRDVATSYKKIGEVYQMQEENDKALECFFKSLEIEKLVYGKSHLEIAISYSNIGFIYHNQGDSHKALEYNLNSLDIYKSVHGENHPDIAISYENIAAVYVKQKDFQKALEYSLKSLEIYKSTYGENDPVIAASSKIIAFIYYKQGEYKQSVEYDLKALEIRRRIYGESDPRIATDFNTIGSTYEKQQKYSQALEYYVKSLDILKSVNGENHPKIATLSNKIALVYEKQDKYDEALEFSTISISKLPSSENHPKMIALRQPIQLKAFPWNAEEKSSLDIACKDLQIETDQRNYKLSNSTKREPERGNQEISDSKKILENAKLNRKTGVEWESQNNFEKAIGSYQKALDMFRCVYGEVHKELSVSHSNLASAYDSLGEHQKALDHLFKAINIREALDEKDEENRANLYNNLALVYESLGQNREALKNHSIALNIRKSIFQENHSDIADSYFNLANIYENLGQNQEALESHMKALKIRECIYGENHPDVAISYNSLVSVLKNLEDFKKAFEYQKKAIQIINADNKEINVMVDMKYLNLTDKPEIEKENQSLVRNSMEPLFIEKDYQNSG